MGTDRGPWSLSAAEGLGKDLFYCCRHESEGIMTAAAGLESVSRNTFMSEMNAMLYKVTSKDELSDKFTSCLITYGAHPPAKKYIETLHRLKEKLCRAYTQYTFSMLHTTTQRSEGSNARIKGHNTELKPYLADADLVTLHDRVNVVNLESDKRALQELIGLREENKRWSKLYEGQVTKSKALAMDKVKDCRALGDSQFMIVKFDQSTSQVNLRTKIVHRGVVFIIPTCDCGFWCSSFVPCLCIARALNANEQKILSVENVHPFHLIQLHPLWPQALTKCKRADYDDHPTVKMVGGGKLLKCMCCIHSLCG